VTAIINLVFLDIAVAAAIASQAEIAVYFAERTTNGVIDLILQAVNQAEKDSTQ